MRYNLANLDAVIEKNITQGVELVVLHGVSREKIRLMEAALGVIFPESYKQYLEKYGAIGVYAQFWFEGIGDEEDVVFGGVVSLTRYAREEFPLPERYIVIQDMDGDFFLCIDTGQMGPDGEAPMVLVDPVDGKQDGDIVSPSFMAYLIEYLSVPINDEN